MTNVKKYVPGFLASLLLTAAPQQANAGTIQTFIATNPVACAAIAAELINPGCIAFGYLNYETGKLHRNFNTVNKALAPPPAPPAPTKKK